MANSQKLDAEYYNNNARWQYKTAARLLEAIELKGNELVLDIGSGDGEVTKEIGQKVPNGHVYGIDIAPKMIDFATKHKKTVRNVSYQLLSAEDLASDRQYNLITSFSAFYWIRNQNKALKQVYKSLKPGGQIFFMVFPKESPYWKPFISAISSTNFKEYASSGQHHNFWSLTKYKKKLEALGFQSIEITIEFPVASYVNQNEYTNYVRGWLRSFINLPTRMEEETFLALTYKKACEQFTLTQKGELLVPYKKVIIQAFKAA